MSYLKVFNREILLVELRVIGAMIMLAAAFFEVNPLVQNLINGHSSLSAWNGIIAVIIIAAVVVVLKNYALAGGILGITAGVWIIILEGGVVGVSAAIITLLFIGGAISILAGFPKILTSYYK
jgi:hypothetical protein